MAQHESKHHNGHVEIEKQAFVSFCSMSRARSRTNHIRIRIRNRQMCNAIVTVTKELFHYRLALFSLVLCCWCACACACVNPNVARRCQILWFHLLLLLKRRRHAAASVCMLFSHSFCFFFCFTGCRGQITAETHFERTRSSISVNAICWHLYSKNVNGVCFIVCGILSGKCNKTKREKKKTK